MARPDLHGGAGDGIAGMVDYQAAHHGPLPLGERRIDNLDRNKQIPQDGRIGHGGCGEGDRRKGGKYRNGRRHTGSHGRRRRRRY